jgi:hypothetical protein
VAAAKAYPGDGYDLVTFFDCLHDMGDPVGAAGHVRRSLAPDGVGVDPALHAGVSSGRQAPRWTTTMPFHQVRMAVATGASVEERAVVPALGEEGVGGRARRLAVRVVAEDDAVVGEVRLRQLQAEELVLVGVVAIGEVQPMGARGSRSSTRPASGAAVDRRAGRGVVSRHA